MYLRCVELDADDLSVATTAQAQTVARRAVDLGANAVRAPSGAIPTIVRNAATSAGLRVMDEEHRYRRRSFLERLAGTGVSSWPDLAPGAAAALLARRHRRWPTTLAWVRSTSADDTAAPTTGATNRVPPQEPVPSNVIATVRRMAGRPGRGFSAPWPEQPSDPAWAPVTVLPEPPPPHLRPGRGFAVNLWLCRDWMDGDTGADADTARVVATVRWAERVHSWTFSGPVPTAGSATIATLPLVRPLEGSLSLELTLIAGAEDSSRPPTAWRYVLTDDAAGVAFWSLSIPDE